MNEDSLHHVYDSLCANDPNGASNIPWEESWEYAYYEGRGRWAAPLLFSVNVGGASYVGGMVCGSAVCSWRFAARVSRAPEPNANPPRNPHHSPIAHHHSAAPGGGIPTVDRVTLLRCAPSE
ncbi:MAG: hypothetical protein IKZ52_07105 [Bacteroidales bacterium]|nr:hypothetical protein [Bacteroidales bacterium]